jgi:hypothetical protein
MGSVAADERRTLDLPSGINLRAELSFLSLGFATTHGFLYERTDGKVPSTIFGHGDDGRHGNFHPLAYQEIRRNPRWVRRLEKFHTASKRVRVRSNWRWKELDCANSSDALLMNIFCHPKLIECSTIHSVLGIESNAVPEFGFRPRTPLHSDRRDNTEIDMRVGDLLVEAKLTESDFQRAKASLVTRYRDIESVFDLSELPVRNGKHHGYQLIRGTLAAYATGCSFCVFCDSRRPDLIEGWYRILRAVRLSELRCRLKLLTWQEMSAALPDDLQQFLCDKYGIFPAVSSGGC